MERVGVSKVAVVIGDAPALISGGAEPISGLTPAAVVAASIAVDPVQIFAVDTGSLRTPAVETIIDGTGGSFFDNGSDLIDSLTEIIIQASSQPFAWFGTSYSGKIGSPLIFDAQGSYDPNLKSITKYEWDFNGDGIFDETTNKETVEHTYTNAFEGYVILRVTSSGGSALASARVVINENGFVPMVDETPCEVDEQGISVFIDENGDFLDCTPDKLPEKKPKGIIEKILDDIEEAGKDLPPSYRALISEIRKKIENKEPTALICAHLEKQLKLLQSFGANSAPAAEAIERIRALLGC